MKIPKTLKHKPVIVVEDYEKIDGRRAYNTDTKGMSLGLAQWNDRGSLEISAKVWRHSGKRWSRQSEELPMHRVLDLAIMICKTKQHFADAYRYEKLYDPQKTTLDRIGLQGDAMTMEICTENDMIEKDIKLFNDVLSKDDELISERLSVLSYTLKQMGY